MIDKGVIQMYVCLPDFSYTEAAVYLYIVSTVQNNKGKPGKNGYSYRTKSRISSDLKISRNKLQKSIGILKKYGLIESREVANYRGGRPLEEYRPLNLLSPVEFAESFGHLLSKEDYDYFSSFTERE